MKNVNRIHTIVLSISWLVVHLILFNYYGVRSFDDTYAYIQGADFLIEHGRLMDSHQFFYSFHIGLIAIFRTLFPGQILPFIVFQCLVSGVAMLALYKASTKLFNDSLAGFFSVLIFLFWLDNIHWNTVALTESAAASVSFFCVLQLVAFKSTLKNYLLIALLVLVIFFIRPTGVVIIVGIVAFLVSYHWQYLNSVPVLNYCLLTGLMILSVAGATLMFAHWDFSRQYEKGNIITYADVLQHGDAFYSENLRIESDDISLADPNSPSILKIIYFISHNPVYVMKAGCLKVWYLVSFVRPYYSKWHNVYSLVWLTFVYAMFYLGFKNLQQTPIKFFVLTVVVINCSLIAISTVDWDNRFYIPMAPGIVLLAGGGMAFVFNKLRNVK